MPRYIGLTGLILRPNRAESRKIYATGSRAAERGGREATAIASMVHTVAISIKAEPGLSSPDEHVEHFFPRGGKP